MCRVLTVIVCRQMASAGGDGRASQPQGPLALIGPRKTYIHTLALNTTYVLFRQSFIDTQN